MFIYSIKKMASMNIKRRKIFIISYRKGFTLFANIQQFMSNVDFFSNVLKAVLDSYNL